jgi:hypothetical protein
MAGREMVERVHPDDVMSAEGLLKMQSPDERAVAVRTVRVNVRENVLDWLASRGMVSERQQRAGERLRVDFERAGLGAKVTMNWDSAPVAKARSGARAGDASLARIDAHRRFHGAMDAVGPGLGDICWRVICGGEGISGAEKGLGWPARSGKLVLGMALDRLARFYGT